MLMVFHDESQRRWKLIKGTGIALGLVAAAPIAAVSAYAFLYQPQWGTLAINATPGLSQAIRTVKAAAPKPNPRDNRPAPSQVVPGGAKTTAASRSAARPASQEQADSQGYFRQAAPTPQLTPPKTAAPVATATAKDNQGKGNGTDKVREDKSQGKGPSSRP